MTVAAKWFRRAAEAGNAGAQSSYGWCLLTGKGVAKDPVEAVRWLKEAAEQGDASGQCCLGFCLANGTGTAKNFSDARKWLTLAADQKDADAKYQLRLLFFRKYEILKWRTTALYVVGYSFLIYHALTTPLGVNGFAVGAFLLILLGCGGVFLATMIVFEKLGLKQWDENEAKLENDRMWSALKQEPWRLLFIPAEDGFFLLPLLYIGINPVSAAVAGLLFAAAHYPFYPWKYCVPKGIAYFLVALWVLPYGIWSVIIAHILLDLALFALVFVIHLEGRPSWRRLIRALRTE
ncbi:MAG: sel1 repeat family protein [Verrucomicrobia subdivision 3 bacterium]|nr:sel1 repeat family protein [Limisphaerales bacterium]